MASAIPSSGLAAAPEIATAVPSVSVPALYFSVGRKPVRAEPQKWREKRNGAAARCAITRSLPVVRFSVALIR